MRGLYHATTLRIRHSHVKYAVSLFAGHSVISLPSELSAIHRFRATLGHLVNHSFLRSRAEFVLVVHPRCVAQPPSIQASLI